MSEEHLYQFVEEIRQYRPRMLFGYPSSLAMIAQHAEDNNIAMHQLGIRVAFVTSERLYDAQRETIERVFGCPVANGYGGRDAGFIAHQCPINNMHITAEDIIVEVVDNDGNPVPNGQAGEITVTHMATRDFPFIRYRTGDVGVLTDEVCACGRGLPVLKEIQGRTTDFIVAKNGTVMHGLALIYVLRDLPGVAEFKIIQESIDHLRVQIVRTEEYSPSNEALIQDEYKKRLGESVVISIEYPTHIAREASGKFRYVVSHVQNNQQRSNASC
jgi:phenylacetate-CoA ligase